MDTLAVRLPDDDDDDDNNVCINVIVDLYSHRLQLYTRKSHEAEALAQNLYSYYMQQHGEYTIESYVIQRVIL